MSRQVLNIRRTLRAFAYTSACQGLIYVQSLRDDDSAWVAEMGQVIQRLEGSGAHTTGEDLILRHAIGHAQVRKPEEIEYRQKVLDCQEFLRSGDSYELCLTDQTEIRLPALKYTLQNPFLWPKP